MDAVDSDFFTAYADVHVHQIMLKDQARNEAYWAALQALAKGKIVLDVGSGTGFLSILAARAGAAHVYAVEASDMAEVSRHIVEDNMLSDNITIIKGRVEDVTLPCMVDIIVSEWMGFYLVHESMMRSVLVARDRFLKPGGCVIPESADIFCAPANCDSDVQSSISWCKNHVACHRNTFVVIVVVHRVARCGVRAAVKRSLPISSPFQLPYFAGGTRDCTLAKVFLP